MAETDALREAEAVEVGTDHPRTTVALSVGGEDTRPPLWSWARGCHLTDPCERLCALLSNTNRSNLTLLADRTSTDGVEGVTVSEAEPESFSLGKS